MDLKSQEYQVTSSETPLGGLTFKSRFKDLNQTQIMFQLIPYGDQILFYIIMMMEITIQRLRQMLL